MFIGIHIACGQFAIKKLICDNTSVHELFERPLWFNFKTVGVNVNT